MKEFERCLEMVLNEHVREIGKLKADNEAIRIQFELERKQLLDQIELLSQTRIEAGHIYEKRIARAESQVESLALKFASACEKVDEFTLRLKCKDAPLESIKLQAKDKLIRRLERDSIKLFTKVGKEREAYELKILELETALKKATNTSTMTQNTPCIEDRQFLEQRVDPHSDEQTIVEPKCSSFKYQEVVRDHDTRKRMKGEDCDCCRDYYRLTSNVKPILELGALSADRKQIISRHRVWSSRPKTPPGFWDVGFPSSQEIAKNAQSSEYRNNKPI